jgi:hypothetical protein
VAQFAAGARQSDDITILAMRRVSVAAPSGAASGLVGAAAGNEPPAHRKSV